MSLFGKKKSQPLIDVVQIETRYFNTEFNQFLESDKCCNPFFDVLLAETQGKKVYARGDRYNCTLYADERPILVTENGNAVKIDFITTEKLPFNFLTGNTTLRYMNMPNLKTIEGFCLYGNLAMRDLRLNELIYMGEFFMHNNKRFRFFQGKKLKEMEYGCFNTAKHIIVDAPNIEHIKIPNTDEIFPIRANARMRKKLERLAEYNAETSYINLKMAEIKNRQAQAR